MLTYVLQDYLHLKWKGNKYIYVTIKNKPKVTKDKYDSRKCQRL